MRAPQTKRRPGSGGLGRLGREGFVGTEPLLIYEILRSSLARGGCSLELLPVPTLEQGLPN